jgi:hypothetical protein
MVETVDLCNRSAINAWRRSRMMKRSLAMKVLAAALIITMQSMFLPAVAGPQTADLSGMVLTSQDQAPLTGVKLHVGDPRTGEIYSSQPTTADGSFSIEGLPAAAYEMAVESNGNFYLVDSMIKLTPGQAENVYVAVNLEKAPSPEEKSKKRMAGSVFNNQLTAAGLVVISAVLIGELIKQATDEDTESPSSP